MSIPSSTRPPPTSPQVTASVIKFRCLYTHDLRRKSKRWHDGNLRYHKFNKRVMVYDDQGNFIGDHHWRSLDEVQDGDEMELEMGVLIEVCENMGTIETDITNLYEKKKSSQGSPQNKDPLSQVPRASAPAAATVSAPIRIAASSQPFRSLNDLLGIKKTSIGHLASPYEQRNPPPPLARAEEPERAPKRQKISVVNTTAERGPRTHSQVIDLTEPTTVAHSRQVSNPLARQATGVDGNSSVRISTSHQQRPVPSKPTHPQRPDPPSFSGVSVPASSEPDSSLPTPQTLIRSAIKAVPPVKPPNDKPKDAPPAQPQRPSRPLSNSISVRPSETELSRPRPNLRGVQQPIDRENRPTDVHPPNQPKPQRPVPPVSRSPLSATSSSSIIRPPAERPVIAEPPNPGETLRVNESPISRENQLQDVLPPAAVPPIQPQKRVSPVSPSNPFITGPASEKSAPAVSSNLQPGKTADNQASNSMPPPSRPLTEKPTETPTAGLRMSVGKPRRKLMYSALLPGASRTLSPATSNTSPGSANRGAPSEPPEQETAAEPVQSAGSTAGEEFMLSTSTQFIFDEMLDGSGFKPSATRALSGRRSLDSPLRKSLSDPTALAGLQERARNSVNTVAIANDPMEQGAWTSEALDLFDFWPAGRPKPDE